ncbi:hypothetical protein ACA910_012120 [Epithemia clementina (nom. ined.)]
MRFLAVFCFQLAHLHVAVQAFQSNAGRSRCSRQPCQQRVAFHSPHVSALEKSEQFKIMSLWASAETGDVSNYANNEDAEELNSNATTASTFEVVDSEVIAHTPAAADGAATAETEKVNIFQRSWRYIVKGNRAKDGLTFRQRMAKMGLAVMLSYGWVSNMSYCICVSIAWYIFARQTGLSPLAPGQWKKFLAVYAGFYVFQNVIRPFRLAASVAVAPQFEKLVLWVQNRLRVKRGIAITITVLMVNLFGTSIICAGMISLAAGLAGVPVLPANPSMMYPSRHTPM